MHEFLRMRRMKCSEILKYKQIDPSPKFRPSVNRPPPKKKEGERKTERETDRQTAV